MWIRNKPVILCHACLGVVLAFFKTFTLFGLIELGDRPQTIIHTDRFKTFMSQKSIQFYRDNNCKRIPILSGSS
jgi:hypothetical protein